MSPIQSLPDEILMHIFSFLSDKESIPSRVVCERWHSLLQNKVMDLTTNLIHRPFFFQSLSGRTVKELLPKEREALIPLNPALNQLEEEEVILSAGRFSEGKENWYCVTNRRFLIENPNEKNFSWYSGNASLVSSTKNSILLSCGTHFWVTKATEQQDKSYKYMAKIDNFQIQGSYTLYSMALHTTRISATYFEKKLLGKNWKLVIHEQKILGQMIIMELKHKPLFHIASKNSLAILCSNKTVMLFKDVEHPGETSSSIDLKPWMSKSRAIGLLMNEKFMVVGIQEKKNKSVSIAVFKENELVSILPNQQPIDFAKAELHGSLLGTLDPGIQRVRVVELE